MGANPKRAEQAVLFDLDDILGRADPVHETLNEPWAEVPRAAIVRFHHQRLG